MKNFISRIGETVINTLFLLGNIGMFFAQVVTSLPTPIKRIRLLLTQLYLVGVKTLIIIVVSGFFVGMVLGLQFYTNLVDFGAEEQIGLLVALTLVRELGPVLTALLFAGRACSALTAEVGLMKATEQLDAMQMMAVDPVKRIIAPRYLAGFISVPLLSAIFTVMGIFGGHFVSINILGGEAGVYWAAMQNGVDFYNDVLNGTIKSVVFGAVITIIGSATTKTVVVSSLMILGLDFLLTVLMFG